MLLLLAVVLTLVGPALEILFSRAVPIQSLWMRIWPFLHWLVAATFTFAAIELLYLLAPNVPVRNRLTIPGAVAAACGWLALSWGLGLYFHYFGELKLNILYGILATPIALLIWLYWGATAILIGAEINVSLQYHRDLRLSGREKELQRRPEAA